MPKRAGFLKKDVAAGALFSARKAILVNPRSSFHLSRSPLVAPIGESEGALFEKKLFDKKRLLKQSLEIRRGNSRRIGPLSARKNLAMGVSVRKPIIGLLCRFGLCC